MAVVLAVALPALAASPADAAGSSLGSRVHFGAYAAGFTGAGTQVRQLESQLGARVSIASSFRGPGDLFPTGEEVTDAASGHTLLVSWDMGSTSGDRFTTYTSGGHDAYLRSAAVFARDSNKTIYLRPWAEMNGDWQPFQPTADGSRVAGGTPAEFVAAWRHVVDVFRAVGANNVGWVFNPTADTYAETTPVGSIFPGAGYVDVLGLDGYNWGIGGPGGWRSFETIFAGQYRNLTALATTLPVWVCEVGSKEPTESDGAPVDTSHTKSAWYSAALASTAFPAVQAFVLFDVRKERDWRVASSSRSLRVVSTAVVAAAGR